MKGRPRWKALGELCSRERYCATCLQNCGGVVARAEIEIVTELGATLCRILIDSPISNSAPTWGRGCYKKSPASFAGAQCVFWD